MGYTDMGKRSLKEQLRVIATSDILVSPSGAQLSLVFGLPRCGALLIILPTAVSLKYYFSTMALSAGVTALMMHYNESRFNTNPICLLPSGVAGAVSMLHDLRQKCMSR